MYLYDSFRIENTKQTIEKLLTLHHAAKTLLKNPMNVMIKNTENVLDKVNAT